MTKPRSRLAGALLVMGLFTSACLARTGTIAPRSPAVEEPESYGDGVLDPSAESVQAAPSPSAHSAHAGMGVLEVSLIDQNKTGPSGIPIRLEGETIQGVTSGKGGLIRAHLPPGTYTLSVVKGCTSELNVLWGQGGRFSILAGETTRGKLGVNWEHRIHPYPPSDSSVTPHWRIGEEVELTFYVVDKCNGNNRIGDAEYPTFRFDPSPNVSLAREPVLKSDPNGVGHIFLRCKSEGLVQVFAVDGDNPADRMDLMEENVTTPFVVRCRDGD